MPNCSKRNPAQAILKLLASLVVACLPAACASDIAVENAAGLTANAQAAEAPDAGGSGEGEKFYDVDCSQVDESGNRTCITDKGTYVGWRTFHATCHACHGQNAVGSSFAPSLLKEIPKERFVDVVTNGYSGQIGVMPAWGENPNVKDFIDELYAYQQARADGVLLPGRPERKD
jgi:cytochrome c5